MSSKEFKNDMIVKAVKEGWQVRELEDGKIELSRPREKGQKVKEGTTNASANGISDVKKLVKNMLES